MNRLTAYACYLTLLIGAGCARFSTEQTDVRFDESGRPATEITTRVSAWTFGASKSSLAKFAARQSEQSQAATVGALEQQSTGTNVVRALEALRDIVGAAAK